MTVLLLAGTAEARALADELSGKVPLIVSLRGVTGAPLDYAGDLRTGGFGGAEGLARYLRAEGIRAVVDATHPFAARMTANAAQACQSAGVPCLRLQRPAWPLQPGWTEVADMAAAVAALPVGARVFLATGSGSDLAPIAVRPDLSALLRVIEKPEHVPPNVDLLIARPPFGEADERALMAREGITHLVAKNAGGAAGHAKLGAADRLGMQVLLIRRPPLPDGLRVVTDVSAARDWVLGGRAVS